MTEIEYIKHLYENEDKSLREISRITESDFRTVQKYAYQQNWSKTKLPNLEAEAYPTLGPYIAAIGEMLAHDAREPRKQRHTVMQIYRRLQEEQDYHGSYSSVKKYVRKKKYVMQQERAGYLPLEHPAGHAQIDFGSFKYYNAEKTAKEGHALVVSFPYSNAGFMQVFESENQECLLEGLKRIFAHIGGVTIRVRADNMTTAVAQVLEGSERVLSEGFRRFMLHYRFQAEFCNPAA